MLIVWITHLFRVVMVIVSLSMLLFGISSIFEKEKRAAGIAFGLFVLFLILFLITFYISESGLHMINIVFLFSVGTMLILFFFILLIKLFLIEKIQLLGLMSGTLCLLGRA